jgi:flavorubredoxin
MNKILKIVGIFFLTIVVVVAFGLAVVVLDLASYTASEGKTLTPDGDSMGKALVVYSPGLSGAATQDAIKIAEDLQRKGYTVNLAGVHSQLAENNVGYDIIAVGGPMYWGQVSGSIDAYLKTIPQNVTLGVFGSTGYDKLGTSDFTSLTNQVASNTQNTNVAIKLILTGNETNDCTALVSDLVK